MRRWRCVAHWAQAATARFAPALQILVALLAAASMPLSIAALVALYAGEASLAPQDVAMQVFKAQLLPLGVGMLTRHFAPALAARVEPTLGRIAGALLILLVLLVAVDVAPVLVGADWRVVLAIVLVTLLAVASGHLLGGPEPATRTAVAVCSAARNPGLALLVATQNGDAADRRRDDLRLPDRLGADAHSLRHLQPLGGSCERIATAQMALQKPTIGLVGRPLIPLSLADR